MSAARLALRTQDNARAPFAAARRAQRGRMAAAGRHERQRSRAGQPETGRGGHRACADGAARNEPRGHLPQTHGNGGNAMRLWLSVEWRKARRRRLWLPLAALVAMQGLWLAWAVRGMDAAEAAQGYLGCLYQLPMMNAIVMPVAAAVLVSRLCDMEHRGDSFKQLFTMQPAHGLFDAKLVLGGAWLLAAVVGQLRPSAWGLVERFHRCPDHGRCAVLPGRTVPCQPVSGAAASGIGPAVQKPVHPPGRRIDSGLSGG